MGETNVINPVSPLKPAVVRCHYSCLMESIPKINNYALL